MIVIIMDEFGRYTGVHLIYEVGCYCMGLLGMMVEILVCRLGVGMVVGMGLGKVNIGVMFRLWLFEFEHLLRYLFRHR